MVRVRTYLVVVGVLAAWTIHPLPAQTTVNPDISLIPRFRLESSDAGSRGLRAPDFTLDELELAVQAYVNPYARADVFLTKPGVGDEPIEVEEAYATFLRGLPLDLNVKIGKYRPEFGKLNATHPHIWPFVTTPLSIARFLGPDGLSDLGINASVLIPTGDVVYTRLSLDLLRGGQFHTIDPRTGAVSGGIGLADTLGGSPAWGAAGRLMSFLPVSENGDLEVGLSGMCGVHDPYHDLRFFYGGADFKYKWKPDGYTSLTIQGEALANVRSVSTGTGGAVRTSDRTTGGGYVYGDYQFHKQFSIGLRLDRSESPYSASDRATGVSVFAGYYPVEETTAFRLEYQRTRLESPDGTATNVNTVALQFMFSMGPHKAHPF